MTEAGRKGRIKKKNKKEKPLADAFFPTELRLWSPATGAAARDGASSTAFEEFCAVL